MSTSSATAAAHALRSYLNAAQNVDGVLAGLPDGVALQVTSGRLGTVGSDFITVKIGGAPADWTITEGGTPDDPDRKWGSAVAEAYAEMILDMMEEVCAPFELSRAVYEVALPGLTLAANFLPRHTNDR